MYLLLSQSFFDGIGANTSLQKEEEKMIERLKERLKGWLKEQLSDGFKIARLVLTGIIGGWLILAVCMYVYKAGEEPKIPEGVFVNEQNISFNDLNIGKEILLCEGSDYYCRQVFNRYTELVSKEFGEPGATLRGESGNPMDRGSITSGWILGNGYEIILSFKHSNEWWKNMGEKPKTTISMLKF